MSGKTRPKKVKSPRTATSAVDLKLVADAKQQFLDSALNMGWQLAVTIIVPVIIGVQLDDHFKTTPAWTLGALFLAVFMSCGVVVKTLHGVKNAQSQPKKGSKRNA